MIEVEEMKNLYRDEFETIFGVKKNIQALRDKVLDLAIQGKLVEQDPYDEPVEELFVRIQTEKKRLIKEKIIKAEKPLSVIEKEDAPFVLPENWEWVRMGEIATKIHYGYTASANESGNAQMLRITDIQNGKVQWDNVPYCTIDDGKINQYKLEENDIVIARTGGTVGKSFLIKDINSVSVFASYLIRIVLTYPEVANYVNFFLDSPYYWKVIGIQSKGTGQPNVNAKQLSSIMVPFPPLAEQKRIVDKIETLMKQINKLEEQLEEKEKLETLIPKAVVTALSNSQDEKELKKNLALVIKNFADVFQTPESLEEFRNVVLRLAYQGKLMSQKQQDEPIEALIEKFQNKNKLKVIPKEDEPFEVPNTWRWIKLKQIGTIVGGGTPKTNVREYWDDGEIPWISPADLSKYKDKYISHGRKSITEEGLSKSSAKLLPTGSVMMSSRAPIGYVAIASNPIATNQGFKSVVPFVLEMNEYIYYYFFAFIEDIKSRSSGTTFKEISGKELGNSLFPLPPLEEQKRIVAKIESLFAVVDQLEEEMKRRERIVETMAII